MVGHSVAFVASAHFVWAGHSIVVDWEIVACLVAVGAAVDRLALVAAEYGQNHNEIQYEL